MNKCLVTTLKAHTNNEALSKYNVLTIKTKASDSPTVNTQWFGISASENGSVSINSPSVGLYQSGISGELYPYPLTVNGYVESHFENKDGIIEVTNKYNLSKIIVGSSGTVRMKEIYGIPATINRLIIPNIEEDAVDAIKLKNALDLSNLTQCKVPYTVVNKLDKNTISEFTSMEYGDAAFWPLFNDIGLNDITNMIHLKRLDINLMKPGNLSSLAKLININRILFVSTIQNNGDIMDFINPLIQAGRTSGKVEVVNLLGQINITLNGSPITYPSGVNRITAYLNWTSDGTVTFTAS